MPTFTGNSSVHDFVDTYSGLFNYGGNNALNYRNKYLHRIVHIVK